ncbi:DUF2680 domain-containing protein [Peribacillus glennii]|uniref:DUF2680 domain-containing protein n=1 Tax=Peribacillus glennii TaxID=2303991 RepID=A0A372LGA9_9BACI|nr:DUF2680 domain-containing protein [Peribacillus glennii]RFU65343.1 DUF2680 domain-containing protein [Peribacillus glennii]
MKKVIVSMCTAFAFSIGLAAIPVSAVEKQAPMQEREIQLTAGQKEELKQIHKNLLEEKKKLIRKYVEFEMITEETGDRIIKRYEDHYKMVEQNGFLMPHHHFHNKRWKQK